MKSANTIFHLADGTVVGIVTTAENDIGAHSRKNQIALWIESKFGLLDGAKPTPVHAKNLVLVPRGQRIKFVTDTKD